MTTTKTAAGVLLALLAFALGALGASPVDANDGNAPVRIWSDCEAGSIEWEYTNTTGGDIRILGSRVILPKAEPFLKHWHRDTTLAWYDDGLQYQWALVEPGESKTTGISGVIQGTEGDPITITPGTPTTAMPDGKYKLHLWLTDGVTRWFVRTAVKSDCGHVYETGE